MKIVYLHSCVILVSIFLLQGCFVGNVRHEPQAAIKVAENFTKSAFVDRDFERALEFTNKEKVILRGKAFETAMVNVQNTAPFPKSVRAIAYEIPFGQSQVIIDLEAIGEGRTFYYRVLVNGDATTPYQVVDVTRSDLTFPKGPLQEPIR